MKKLYILATALMMGAGAALAALGDAPEAKLPQRSISQLKQITPGKQRLHTAPGDITPMAMPMMKDAPEGAVTVPFSHTLGKGAEGTDLYTVIDANEDGKTWKLGGFSSYSVILTPAEGFDTNDDWIVSPPIEMKAGVVYEMSYNAERATTTTGKTERLGVFMGDALDPVALTTELVPYYEISEQKLPAVKKTFSVETDGYYYIGFHSTSEKAKCASLKLFNFGVTMYSDPIDPPAEGSLSYTLHPAGELKADVTYTAPTLTQGGKDFDKLSKVEVKTNWVVSNTFENVAPGETLNFTVDLMQGKNNCIEVTPYIEDTPGSVSEIKYFFAGMDSPQPLTNVKATLSDDGMKVTVSWDAASEVGENGGYVDVSNVTYYIFDAFGSYYDPAIATTAETSYEFDYSSLSDQDFMAYQVTAGVGDYYSLDVATNIVTVGAPYDLPFVESFADGYYEQMWCVDPTSDNIMCGTVNDNELQTNADDDEAEPVYLNSQDGDNGFFLMLPLNKDDKYGFFSAKIDISAAANPVLEFFTQGKGNVLDVMIAADGGDFEVVKTLDFMADPTDGWTLCRIDLAPYKDKRYIQMELRITARDNTDEQTWSVPLDNIRIRDLKESDLAIKKFIAPASAKPETQIAISATIENLGTSDATGASVKLTRNGETVAEQSLGDIASMGIATVYFTDAATLADADEFDYELTVSYDADMDQSNNSAAATVKIDYPLLPMPENVAAETDGTTVNLTWSQPDFSEQTTPVTVTDDFENPDYEMFAYENIGPWTCYDGDGARNYTFLSDANNPYRTMPMAFQLFDPVKAGVPSANLVDADPHSGSTMLVAWSSQGNNLNYLISPELPGIAQTISFWAKSFTIAWAESFKVLYSTTGCAISDFIEVETVENYPANGNVPEVWTEYKADLPEGTKYFAILHDSSDTYALYLDDITYTGGSALPTDLEVTGYNIYRGGELITEQPVAETAYTDQVDQAGTYSYRVSAVYNHGESRLAEAVEVEIEDSGIAEAITGIAVKAAPGTVIVTGASGKMVTIAMADGRIAYRGIMSTDNTAIRLPAGAYIVTVGTKTSKLILR